ncbi:MAG: hypothetical protein Q4D61_04970, partial [Cardiobacteriaceae bacterium]|nr:hypothetical protein [Cardiobacteriaceae bacterium]
MRNIFALLLSLGIHAAIAAFFWRMAQGGSAPEEGYQPFDLKMLVMEEAPPAPETVAAPEPEPEPEFEPAP